MNDERPLETDEPEGGRLIGPPTELTTSQINKAGKVLRHWWEGPAFFAGVEEQRALEILTRYRAAHSRPLIKANNGLRSMVKTEGCRVQVSQRLKRMSTILDKLARHPTMALSRMQDIGGCRAIVDTLDELRRVQKRITLNRSPQRVDDYVTLPRPSGYRAVHLVVEYDGRCIEIQLRTWLMHEWAVAVERIGGRMDVDLKSGKGPSEVLEWLEAVSEAMAIEDAGGEVEQLLTERIGELRGAALPFLPGGQR